MTEVVLDSDFLSAFLKIDQLPLVRDFYRIESVTIPAAVFREVGRTPLLTRLTAMPWIQVTAPEAAKLNQLLGDESFLRLGPGEQEVIALAVERQDVVVLMNDNQARRTAARFGIEAISIPAFLLACKLTAFLDRPALARIIDLLRERDRYSFRQDVLDRLLS